MHFIFVVDESCATKVIAVNAHRTQYYYFQEAQTLGARITSRNAQREYLKHKLRKPVAQLAALA